MKKLAVLLMSLLIFGCSDSDDDKNLAEDNGQWAMIFKETVKSDSNPVNRTERFLYENERLIQHSVKQRYFDEEITHEVNLTYFDNLVITTTEGLTLVYTLNSEGYASHCVYESPSQNRIYRFSYSIDGYLTDIIESIDGIEFSSASLTYENGDITSVNTKLNGYDSKHIYQPGEESSNYHLPCLGLLELHPFTFHLEAFYAGILGKAPRHFTVRSNPDDDKYKEYTNYTYSFDKNGNPTQLGCKTYYNGQVAQHYPDNRSISVSFE